ncbi:MAG: acyl-CoA dehydratase activase [Alkalispirochaeta sp.]
MEESYLLGVDVGSTTVKLALLEPVTHRVVYHRYMRHGSRQRDTTIRLIRELAQTLPDIVVQPIFTGSGSHAIGQSVGLSHVQEVVANSVAVRRFYPDTRVAIELGGQDAKVIFFHPDPATGELHASDMRMNGSCAGGTGAFIDEVAKLLKTPVEQFDDRAARGSHIYQISGRCGVFAKTDIQPLLNQGIDRSDLALSTFHAVARQTIGGLAQGLQIKPPVIFQGGPLTFNHTLLRVFAERLKLAPHEVIRPDQPEIFVAMGAALAVPLIAPQTIPLSPAKLAEHLAEASHREEHERVSSITAGGERDAIPPFFADEAERRDFFERHARPDWTRITYNPGSAVDVYIGIDAGSTTTKMVILDQSGTMLDSAYSHNDGEPLRTGVRLLTELLGRYEAEDVTLRIQGLGTTGYGEKLFAAAFHADYHTVETVAHAHAALEIAPAAGFVLDIGGQDMKAITVTDGIVTGISLNEACSAGCGSFLENFAHNLDVPVQEIANRAFTANAPSQLGSRCTVFMNSSIITEQKNGKGPADILAGLCRSIVENVFTKVVRVPNFELLGETVVVQGGTFENDAVLRALEQYTGRRVVRAPHPGLMGAIGVARLTQQQLDRQRTEEQRHGAVTTHTSDTTSSTATAVSPGSSRFTGLEELGTFDVHQESGHICPWCSNACHRTIIRFGGGSHFVTGNRCERGEVIETAAGAADAHARVRRIAQRRRQIPNLMTEREELLFRRPVETPLQSKPTESLTIGIPRTLEFWHSYPFWYSFWSSLGYSVQLSDHSTKELFEDGLASVPSDTVCFPAKLAHGHLRDLIAKRVDRIFMPMINRMPPENPSTTSNHVCAVVKGYPMVLDVSDEPEKMHGIPFDRPMFHWVDDRSRRRQLLKWATTTLGVDPRTAAEAIDRGNRRQTEFESTLMERGGEVLQNLEGTDDGFAVVIAGRPYHSDRLVNHDLAAFFMEEGVPVLTADSLPGLHDVDLSGTRSELTVNFHVRMYSAAMKVAQHPKLELVQIVSFGCGHDAVISDEVVRVLEKGSGKSPLTLKLDETDVKGPLAIRIRSFIETVRARRAREAVTPPVALPEPFSVKYRRPDRKEKVIMAPNVSRAFATIISAAIRTEGYRIEPLPMADRRAIELGKRYIHNDMCFPAQVNVGEMLRALETGAADPAKAVCGLAKSQCDCRLAHYASLARRALDDAGYPQVPIITTDIDTKNMHPGFKLSPLFQLRMLWALGIVDALEALRLRLRPYEVASGEVDAIFETGVEEVAEGIEVSVQRGLQAFERCVDRLRQVELNTAIERPQVFIIGEFLLNFHPTSNYNIVEYLEANGMEVVLPNILDSFRRDFMRMKTERKEFFIRHPFADTVLGSVTDYLFDHVLARVAKIAMTHPRYHERVALPKIAERSEEIVHHTFTSGEGWMIAGEILHHAAEGIRSFLILQPFGCLPNHVTGRGLVKRLKEIHPETQILSLDYDPDTSFANIENRLQMLILNSRMSQTVG